MEPFLVIGGIIFVVVIIVVIYFYREKKRTEGLKSVAEEMKFSFSKKGNGQLLTSLGDFHLFSQGYSRRISNVMHGRTENIDVTIFDYRYTIGGGKSSHTYSQTVMCFRSSSLRLPTFTLRPEHVFHKLGQVFGYQDIDFPEHPTFSSRYLLRGQDEDSIRSIFTERVISHFEKEKGLSTEGSGERLIFYRLSKRISPNEIRPFMEEGFAIFGLFKSPE